MNSTRTYARSFLGLAILGFVLLWLGMLVDGTLIALLRAGWTGAFADGRPLRTKYTGVWLVDFAIAVVVSFFNEQTDGRDPGAWLFIFDFQFQLQATFLWFLIEASRQGPKQNLLTNFLSWSLLTNLFGAAVALPLYLRSYVSSVSAIQPTGLIPVARARAIPLAMFLTAYSPLLVMMYAKQFTSDSTRQAIIAVQLFSPMLTVALVGVISPAKAKAEADADDIGADARIDARCSVRTAYLLSGIVGGVVHLYTLGATFLPSESNMAWARLLIPSPSKVRWNSPEIIHDGGLLFLQFDYIIVSATCCLWLYFLVSKKQVAARLQSWVGNTALIFISIFFLGPCATVSAVLYLREH